MIFMFIRGYNGKSRLLGVKENTFIGVNNGNR